MPIKNTDDVKMEKQIPDNIHGKNKTKMIVGLFLAATVTLSAGCSSERAGYGNNHVCIDDNKDGYCDYDGQPMNSSLGTRTHYGTGGYYYGTPHYGGTYHSTPSPSGTTGGISSGTSAAHGGIGSSGVSSGG